MRTSEDDMERSYYKEIQGYVLKIDKKKIEVKIKVACIRLNFGRKRNNLFLERIHVL